MKLYDIFELAKEKGRPVREVRTWYEKGLIPGLKLGHRSLRFDIVAVDRALKRFEIPAVDAK